MQFCTDIYLINALTQHAIGSFYGLSYSQAQLLIPENGFLKYKNKFYKVRHIVKEVIEKDNNNQENCLVVSVYLNEMDEEDMWLLP